MTGLIKYNLDFDKAMKFTRDNLDQVNSLSSELLNSIIFQDGSFFTLLPAESNLEKLYEFEAGLILPQNPTEEYISKGHKATYSKIPTIRHQLADLIVQEIKESEHISCLFDDTKRSFSDKAYINLYHTNGIIFQNEIYYLITKENVNANLIIEGLRASNSFWHSLGILTTANFSNKDKRIISLNQFQEIAQKTVLIIMGAYDGEGYIFWKPNNIMSVDEKRMSCQLKLENI